MIKALSSYKTLRHSGAINPPSVFNMSVWSQQDIELFKLGSHYRLYKKFGAHCLRRNRLEGTYFSLWAPQAKSISVVGDFNQWDEKFHRLQKRSDQSGIWEGFIPEVSKNEKYKFCIFSHRRRLTEKCDPFAFFCETPPQTSSIIWDTHYQWKDSLWMRKRRQGKHQKLPMSIYEMHLGSWRKQADRFQSYQEIAETLVPYIQKMGFTHVEFLPIMEHPFYGSWGYQTLGYFAPTSRHGTPQDLMSLIDSLHQHNIGVILDWVPSHFPADRHGLADFDGTNLFEYKDLHPDWNSSVFNNGRLQVIDFLISSALFWLDQYHIDGLRVDAVSSMLYLDYSRKKGQWNPNFYGGYENLESVAFLRRLNEAVYQNFPDVHMIAEESTMWQSVSKPAHQGGLHFDMKWNMGWMQDTLNFFRKDPKVRGKCLAELTHCSGYAFTENFLLPLSHDEVVHEKSSLLGKMPGKDQDKFANLKCLYGYMFAYPGKKLLFMGSEIALWNEWNHDEGLDWNLLQYDCHLGIQRWVKDLNKVYRSEKALSHSDFDPQGLQWLNNRFARSGVLTFMRSCPKTKEHILIVCNLNNKHFQDCQVRLPIGGRWKEIIHSENKKYHGQKKGHTAIKKVQSVKQPSKKRKNQASMREFVLRLDLLPLSVAYFKKQKR